ncbi:MAG TPA: GNAT family N-acetyltransferase [Marmoricola sp.]|nr:GNAT family N-acetyltransferase [Marmoricola sp.]
MQVRFRPGRVDAGDGAALLAAFAAEIAELYDGLDIGAPGMPTAGPDDLGPPGGAFLVGYAGDAPVCCGGVKRLPDGACELKRMYVVPAARRQGIARALLHALEETARELGFRTARMDTGPRQQHALAFYESEGYRPIGNFNANPAASWWGEKSL